MSTPIYDPHSTNLSFYWDMLPHYGSPVAIYQKFMDGSLTRAEERQVNPECACTWYLAEQLKRVSAVLDKLVK